ncbi:MAG: PQQ-binding-like beta-propeller repeat protein [candidate division NC10 bacterium]|nr:PQQ-binding-like beta-propeller repeat protein [candidate division NC10 bacterium]
MKGKRAWCLFLVTMGLFTVAVWLAPPAWAVSSVRLEQASKDPNNWLMAHGTYEGWQYSGLDQINKSNVKDLKVAWIHQPGTIEHGLETAPLAVDGVVYYSASYNRVFALDGATGKEIWHYYHPLDLNLIKTLFFQPFNRGLAVGWDKIFMGTLDGKLVALDMKTGKKAWETTLVDTKKCSCNFTGAPIIAKDKVVIGQTAGELPIRGKIFAVNAMTGEKAWQFETVAGPEDPEAMKTWGGDSWKYGGGGGWMVGTFDPALNLVLWGTSNPAPDYDWGGKDWETGGARPGLNLYTSSVVALDADTGKLRWYFQEMPHDFWDYDSALGEFMFIDRGGQKLLVHQNKSGFVFVYNRTNGRIVNVYPMQKNYNFVKGIDPKTGKYIEPNIPELGKANYICPWIAGGRSWNAGAYSPKTGLWYNTASEACEEVTIIKQTPTTEPAAGLYFGGDQVAKHTPTGPAYGHLDALDPITGERKWVVNFKYPQIAFTMATAGGLVFYGGDLDGRAIALDADTGAELWSFRMGSANRGAIISYAVDGKQYVAIPSGLGSLVMGLYPALWPEVADMPAGAALIVFTLPE